MNDVEVTRHGEFDVATARGMGGFTSWAKMGRIHTDCPIKEPGAHVWFGRGPTRILVELGLTPNVGIEPPRSGRLE